MILYGGYADQQLLAQAAASRSGSEAAPAHVGRGVLERLSARRERHHSTEFHDPGGAVPQQAAHCSKNQHAGLGVAHNLKHQYPCLAKASIMFTEYMPFAPGVT